MTQANYSVMIDINRNRSFVRGLTEGTALNLIDNPQQLRTNRVGSTINPPTYTRWLYQPDYIYTWSFTTGTSADAAMSIGDTSDFENGIWITSGSQITVRLDFRGDTNYVGETLTFAAFARAGTTSASTNVVLTGSWQTASLTFTPDSEHLLILITRITTTTDVTYSLKNLFVVPGADTPDAAFNDGAASDYYEDVTTYVQGMSWNNGMDGYDQLVSGGARATITLDNRDGQFDSGNDNAANVLLNGDFTAWSFASHPTFWTGTNTSANLQTTQVGSDELHGGSGLGALNLYATSRAMVSCSQTILTAYQRYKVTFSIGASSGLGGVRFFTGTAPAIYPISRIYTLPGVYTFYFTATSDSTFGITNNRYPCDITIEYVEAVPVPRYAGLAKQTMVAIRGYDSATEYQLFVGRLDRVKPFGGRYDVRTVTLDLVDAMAELNELEYKPAIISGNALTVPAEFDLLFDQVELAYPYIKDYFVLDTSFLGIDTWLFAGNALEEGSSLNIPSFSSITLDFAISAASNTDKGIAAASYIRDLMNAEMDGRFYVNGRNGAFTAQGRLGDPSLVTDSYSLTDGDYEQDDPRYADDIMNKVTIWFRQRFQGASDSVLWASTEDISIPAQGSKTVTGKYRNPDNELINATALTVRANLVRGVDFVVSPTAFQSKVTVATDAGSQSATFYIENNRQVDVALTTLQIRGTPIYVLSNQSVTVNNSDSIYEHGIQERSYNIPLLSNIDDVIGIATGRVTMYGNAIERLDSITFITNKLDARWTRALVDPIGLRIAIAQGVDNHTADYVVIGERWGVSAGGENTTNVTWVLKPCARSDFWILGEVGRSELGTTTIPIF